MMNFTLTSASYYPSPERNNQAYIHTSSMDVHGAGMDISLVAINMPPELKQLEQKTPWHITFLHHPLTTKSRDAPIIGR